VTDGATVSLVSDLRVSIGNLLMVLWNILRTSEYPVIILVWPPLPLPYS
jgi:hypothetical protein